MNFKFDISLCDEDYYDFNKFVALKSYYGKKQTITMQIIIGVIFLIAIAANLFAGSFSKESIVGMLPLLLLGVVLELLLIPYFKLVIKLNIRSMKKRGKLAYSKESVLEFSDDGFREETPEQKSENKYSAIERISVIENKNIYIHSNNILGYIVPFSCFKDSEDAKEFLEFLKLKCEKIKYYK